jgi:hypothetical protein
MRPHTIQSLVALVFLAATSSLCSALESIEFVTPARAKELGLEVRAHAAGPQAVRIELEFEAKGELQNYSRVAFEMYDGDSPSRGGSSSASPPTAPA